MAFTILNTSGSIESLSFDYNETTPKLAKYYAGLKRDADNSINVLTTSLVPNTSIAYDNGSDWCSVTLGSTESNTGKSINISCSYNTERYSRTCRIYLKYDNKLTQGYIYVSQNVPEWTITCLQYPNNVTTSDDHLSEVLWYVRHYGTDTNLNGSDVPTFTITKLDGSNIGTATHTYFMRPSIGIYMSNIENLEPNQEYTVTASLGSSYGNASTSFTLYQKTTFDTVSVGFAFLNGNYFTRNSVGVVSNSNLAIVIDGYFALDVNTDKYAGNILSSYYVSTATSTQQYVTVSNYGELPVTRRTLSVPDTWSSITIYKNLNDKGNGPSLQVIGGTSYTGGSVGTILPIHIGKEELAKVNNVYLVTILIKPGGYAGNPLPKYEIQSK